jgi:oxygen-independent coproporphyrinogen III oxidase
LKPKCNKKLSGIYLHIPFCKQACHYCDFHFSTNTKLMEHTVDMICKELVLQKHYLGTDTVIKTVYFGGGTPSLLPTPLLEKIMETIHIHYRLELEETTIETNPDDLNREKLQDFKALGFDRLSIGIQSFDEGVLKFYNRAHNATESRKSIALAQAQGFEKLSIDLMYGFPAADHGIWKNDLELALQIDPGHISSYCLTIEPKTALGNWASKGKFTPSEEDFNAIQFEMLQEATEKAGYLQYEISNFARPDSFAVHNSNYWKGVPYLGIGPSAHSFDGKSRQHNIANNIKYNKSLQEDRLNCEADHLSKEDLVNEYILTSLRTIWGTDLDLIESNYGISLSETKAPTIALMQKEGLVSLQGRKIILSKKGKLLADMIAEKLFI